MLKKMDGVKYHMCMTKTKEELGLLCHKLRKEKWDLIMPTGGDGTFLVNLNMLLKAQ
jgi:diacylglycerol kinase family enzyme